jgi:hypothetical protein
MRFNRKSTRKQNRTIQPPNGYAVIFPQGTTAATFPDYVSAARFQAYVAKRFLIPTTVKAI